MIFVDFVNYKIGLHTTSTHFRKDSKKNSQSFFMKLKSEKNGTWSIDHLLASSHSASISSFSFVNFSDSWDEPFGMHDERRHNKQANQANEQPFG